MIRVKKGFYDRQGRRLLAERKAPRAASAAQYHYGTDCRAPGSIDDLPTRWGGFGMSQPAHVGDVLGLNARLNPDKIGARDLERSMTFRQWHQRACRLANALIGIGLSKGDRVCILAYNCL